jgi:hypothetical protein
MISVVRKRSDRDLLWPIVHDPITIVEEKLFPSFVEKLF